MRLLCTLRRLMADRAANVAVIAGLTVLPILGLTGMALDWRLAEAVKHKLQDATDSAALAAARAYSQSAAQTDSVREAKGVAAAQQLFAANVASETSLMVDPALNVNFVPVGETVRVDATASSRMAFGGLFGQDRMNIGVAASALAGNPRRLEVVLSLDNTGSMAQGNRMNLMRAAAKKFVDTLFNQMDQPDMLFIGVEPWASTVNIKMEQPVADWTPARYDSGDPGQNGTGYGSWPAPFRDFTAYAQFPFDHNLAPTLGGQAVTAGNRAAFDGLFGADGWRGCVRQADGERRITGGAVSAMTDAPPPHMLWTAHALEAGAAADPNAQCVAPMLGLSASRQQIKRALDRMRPDGNTHQDVGLMWGMRMLSPRGEWASFFGQTGQNQPKAYDPGKTRKILVLLTDGENTTSSGAETYYGCTDTGARGGAGPCWASPDVAPLDNASLDALMLDACTTARENYQIELYTIAVDVTNAGAISLLDRCAGGPNSPRFENIHGEDIDAVLQSIAKQSVRLTE